MKKFVALVFVALFAAWAWAHQYEEEVDGVIWYYNVINDNEAEITYRGDFEWKRYSDRYAGALLIPDTINGYSVSKIGEAAFYGCDALTAITIPSSVTSIDSQAFSNCSSIEYVTVSEGLAIIGESAFSDCSVLRFIKIPAGVVSIEDRAFNGCGSLTSIAIPYSVASIGNGAFANCGSLKSFDVDEDNQQYCSRNGLLCSKDGKTVIAGVNGDVLIPDGVTSIGENAFESCRLLTAIKFPDSMAVIGEWAFNECSALRSVKIPNGVILIGRGAFAGCSSLMSITMPESLTSIGESAFDSCGSLQSIIIPQGIETICANTFCGCSSLTSITMFDSITSIEEAAFANCSSVVSITIPGNVTTIGDCAFAECSSLRAIKIPSSVTLIGELAFADCGSLKSFDVDENNQQYCSKNGLLCSKDGKTVIAGVNGDVLIPDGTVTIGANAFCGCSSLMSITMFDGISSIEEAAFANCSSMASITMPETIAYIGDSAFAGCRAIQSIAIPDSTTTICDYAFSDCCSLSSITIPDNVISIGRYAFDSCGSLTSIAIPYSVASIGNGAFANCHNLEEVDIQQGTTSGYVANSHGFAQRPLKVGDYAFISCYKIKSVAFPERLKEIGKGVFYKCLSLKEVLFYGDKPFVCENFYEGIPDGTIPTTYIGVPPTLVIPNMTSFTPPNDQSWKSDIAKGDFLGYPIKRLLCVSFDFSRGRSISAQGGLVINNQGSVVTSPTTAITATIGDESLRNNIVPGSTIGRFPQVTKDNFSLKGWTVGDEYIDENYVVESNIVIKARWRPIVGDLNPTLKSFMAEVGENNPDSLTILNKKLISGEIVMSSDEASLIIEWLLDEIDADKRKATVLEEILDAVYDKSEAVPNYNQIQDVVNVIFSSKPIADWPKYLDKVNQRTPAGVFEEVICCAIERLMNAALKDLKYGSILIEVCEKYNDRLPLSIKATVAEGLSDVAIEHLQYMKEVARIYELSGDAIPISIRVGLSEKIETAVVSQKAIYPGIKEALYALGIDGDDRWNRICATVLEIELGDLLSLTSSEVCEWIAYDLAEQYSSKYNVDKRGYLNLFKAKYGDAYENMLAMQTGKIALDGRMLCVGHDYLAGTDPLDPNDKFTASVTIVDGKPVVSYTPELDDARKALRKYTTYGKEKLTDTEWVEISEGEEVHYNFFKVTVEMK